jgi:hypothetical protein
MEDDPIDELAEKGRRAQAASARAADDAAERWAESASAKLIKRARLCASPFSTWRWSATIALAVPGFAAVIYFMVRRESPFGGKLTGDMPLALMLLSFAWPVLVFSVLTLVAWIHGGSALLREEDWIASLPFPVDRHLEMLGYDRTRTGQEQYDYIKVKVTFSQEPPSQLVDAFRSFGDVTVEGPDLILESPDILHVGSVRRRYILWFHNLVDHLLLPASKRLAITSVRLKSKGDIWEDKKYDW